MKFPFLITYFKPSGKYYTSAVVCWDIAHCTINPQLAYYQDAIAKLRGLKNNGGQGALPGLGGDGWDGYMVIEQADLKEGCFVDSESSNDYIPNGVPHLITP